MASKDIELPASKAGSITPGIPVVGGTHNTVLYIDNSGNLASSTNLEFFSGLNTFIVQGEVHSTVGVFTDSLNAQSTGAQAIDVFNYVLINGSGGSALNWSTPGEIDISGLLFVSGQFLCDDGSISSDGSGNFSANSLTANAITTPNTGTFGTIICNIFNDTANNAVAQFNFGTTRLYFDANSVLSADLHSRALYDNATTSQLSWDTSGVHVQNLQVFGTVIGTLAISGGITVGGSAQLDNGRIGTNGAGLINFYNNQVVQGNGVVTNVKALALTNQGATIGATTLFTPAATATRYLVNIYLVATTAGTSGTVSATIAWNDGTGARTTTTPNITFGSLAAPVTISQYILTNTAAVTYATTVTAAVGTPKYELYIDVLRLA